MNVTKLTFSLQIIHATNLTGNTSMLELQNISKAYGDRTVLSDISLSIEKGEIVSILGPSGCGKTTLLNLVLGLVTATDGRILFDGVDLTHVPMEKRGFNILNFSVSFHSITVNRTGLIITA